VPKYLYPHVTISHAIDPHDNIFKNRGSPGMERLRNTGLALVLDQWFPCQTWGPLLLKILTWLPLVCVYAH